AISYLVRRLEENAQPHNFLHALFTEGPSAVGDQEARFRASVAAMATVPTDRRRRSDRPPAPPRFANTTDSDPALPEVRAWAAERVAAPAPAPTSPVLGSRAEVDEVGAAAGEAQAACAALPA